MDRPLPRYPRDEAPFGVGDPGHPASPFPEDPSQQENPYIEKAADLAKISDPGHHALVLAVLAVAWELEMQRRG